MSETSIVESFFLIFSGAAVFATFALFTRQPLIIAYIALGVLIGPYGLHYVSDAKLLSEISEIGIIFLLFLLGLDMQPKSLAHMLKKATLVALISSAAFASVGFAVAYSFGFSTQESLLIGVAMMFSSTIIGIKLLPTTVLHHRHTGELVVGLLLLQDLIAIIVLLVLSGGQDTSWGQLASTAINLPLLVIFAFFTVKIVLLRVIQHFDRFHEFIFLVAIGWCLGVAELAKYVGLSLEIGAFIAGISLATSPISLYIAEHLKPLRDFFLILFFFTLGAQFNINLLGAVAIPAIILAIAMLVMKPFIFQFLLRLIKEPKDISWEVGFRLGQISEFSLLIAFLATSISLMGEEASTLIQATAILTFLVNSYFVIFRYPSPIAISDELRRD
ncbi:MAG: cation:proton antiporter [Pseudomonadales bacterium]|uniref:Kef-type K+ transport system NAD-binding protein n=1 Tax=Oleiphilus messinensis TaxID=141451 RepID=A0A1Y0I973_9GAMM|nr:cation:proton antiporter [Oleiphilus messinensis]ARU57067.1 Kef-type K+ transport system NAD-binding protein [Oleiphilus messinensis]MCG8610434.1 cation:proton antiporter [Pseudomonadales bacterium]